MLNENDKVLKEDYVDLVLGHPIYYWQIKDLARVNKFESIRCLKTILVKYKIENIAINNVFVFM